MEDKKKGFKVVEGKKSDTEKKEVVTEIPDITAEDIKAEIELLTNKGTALQKYITSEKGNKEAFAIKRLKMEQFNAYCSLIECLQAQLSVMSK